MVNEEEEKRNKSIFDQVNAFFSFLFFFFSKVDLFFLSSMRRLMQKMTLRHLSNWRHFLLGNHKKRFARPNNDCDHWEKKRKKRRRNSSTSMIISSTLSNRIQDETMTKMIIILLEESLDIESNDWVDTRSRMMRRRKRHRQAIVVKRRSKIITTTWNEVFVFFE